ncbi:aminoglycoside phosphotransferase [Niallia circulans]|uniref:phosphotransferase n=1 Tax=Niallia TaxID=2837506 RepID=UPI00077C57F9|nr:phosphotransferase [Niallia circulans]MCM2980598.1 phosphotransferase [Niallia circulans]MED3841557.1 phosphotransferase [Niallia circulans]MED4243293.1 phosphotransferase [Niallia circulans]MED4248402.1 phosphotransferase [Niallia circulans]MED5102203.1 phosphotransferase [Niallia circulans]
MIYDFFHRGDDTFYYRLLSLLEKKIPFQIIELSRIRNDVYLIKTKQYWIILKGFTSYQKLKVQVAFTRALKQEGFTQTYQFYEFDEEPIVIDNKVYGLIEYLPPHKDSFSYHSKRNRREALQLLEHYYSVTERLVEIYKYILPTFHLMKKFEHRLEEYRMNIPIIEQYVKKDIVKEIMEWADYSFGSIKNKIDYLDTNPNVILHGDVAHHNFLRVRNNELYLIDFDLISIGPRIADYLQFANRILPDIGWSIQDLQSMQGYADLFKDKWFLMALIYPTDILREWNRIIRNKDVDNAYLLEQVQLLTTNQFHKRKKFYQKLQQLVGT